MSKTGGLGDHLYVAGYDFSGDIGSVGKIAMLCADLDFTGINVSAHERRHGLRDGEVNYAGFLNTAAGQEHAFLKTAPTSDVQVEYWHGAAIGNDFAGMLAKDVSYGFARAANGELKWDIVAKATGATGRGLEWGLQLTAGQRTDTAATNGASLDFGSVSSAFGLSAYLQVFSFSGTDATVKLQDSADNVTFADVAGAAFTQVTSGPQAQTLETSLTATVRRYVRAVTVTAGGFTSLVFTCGFNRYLQARDP